MLTYEPKNGHRLSRGSVIHDRSTSDMSYMVYLSEMYWKW